MIVSVRNVNRVTPTPDVSHSHDGSRFSERMTQRTEARSVADITADDAVSAMDALGDETEDASLFFSELSKRSDRRSRAGTAAGKSLSRLASRLQEGDLAEAFPVLELLPAVVEGRIDPSELPGMIDNPGEMALLLAAALTQMPYDKRRKALSDILDETVGKDDWALALFSRLEFKGSAEEVRIELASIYEVALGRECTLVQLFERLKTLKQRSRKVRVLIRALGAEMAQRGNTDRIRLASVNRELKRLLLFMGLEEQCTFIAAASLNDPTRREDILKEILSIADEPWPTAGWMLRRIRNLCMGDQQAYRYTVKARRLMQMLPDSCFIDDAHREQIVTVLMECAETLDAEG
jgi:type III secretion system YopN/LcrE/InvE/MxiC family regulator